MIGFFVNMLPLLVESERQPGVTELLQRVRPEFNNLRYAHPGYAPFEKIVEGFTDSLEIRGSTRSFRLFQILSIRHRRNFAWEDLMFSPNS